MDKQLIDIIKKQTGITDELIIEKKYYECNNSETDTIIALCNIATPAKSEKSRTLFDEMREIMDDKAYVYQNLMNNLKKNKST